VIGLGESIVAPPSSNHLYLFSSDSYWSWGHQGKDLFSSKNEKILKVKVRRANLNVIVK
jgi:hypothetical protein